MASVSGARGAFRNTNRLPCTVTPAKHPSSRVNALCLRVSCMQIRVEVHHVSKPTANYYSPVEPVAITTWTSLFSPHRYVTSTSSWYQPRHDTKYCGVIHRWGLQTHRSVLRLSCKGVDSAFDMYDQFWSSPQLVVSIRAKKN